MANALEKRCEDCINAIKKNNIMCCSDLWDRPCKDIAEDECPEDIQISEISEITEKAKANKIDHGVAYNKSDKERKLRTSKVSDEKTQIFNDISTFLSEKYDISIAKPNKLIEITLNSKKFKLDLIEQRPKK